MLINQFAWMIPLFPLFSFLILIFGRKYWNKDLTAFVGILFSYLSFHLAVYLFISNLQKMEYAWSVPWFEIGQQAVRLGIEVQPLNAIMLIVVSLVSLLVHLYSWGYMKDDDRFTTYYAYLSLFTFSMFGLVVSPNLLQIYLFWELVGVSSFLLIGFWYQRKAAVSAAKKAFIMTRIGDMGLFIAISLIFWQVGSFELSALREAVYGQEIDPGMITLLAILIFVAAIGKSGQFPLHTWLPDAMEGPTPVSALIHAATMVAAGVYLVANTFWLFQASPLALDVVAYVGGFTAIFAALIAITQNDIKKVLAYSTVSQLGFMMLGLGSLSLTAGVYHLVTHAFFKALLFLVAGAVIVVLNREQDIRKMGGLLEKNYALGVWFCIGCLALAGIPPFAGYFSKEAIILATYADGRIDLFVIGLITVFLTAFYIFRLYFLVFAGSPRGEAGRDQLPSSMTFPVHLLGILTVFIGFINFPQDYLDAFLTRGVPFEMTSLTETPGWVPILTVVLSLIGIGFASHMYGKTNWKPRTWKKPASWIHQLLTNKFYIDQLYNMVVILPLKGLGYLLTGIDRFVIGGLIQLSGWFVMSIGGLSTRLQNGQAQTYAFVSGVGLVLLILGVIAGRLWI